MNAAVDVGRWTASSIDCSRAWPPSYGVQIQPLAIRDVLLIRPRMFEDPRGAFAEIYNHEQWSEHLGLSGPFVQDNWSYSRRAKTVRALHFQRPPQPQGKLVRVTRGSIKDVALDVRRGSPTYGRHVMATLSAQDLGLLWIPAGFAHGYVTLEDDTEVTYKVTHRYDPKCEVGIQWNDPKLGIDWDVSPDEATVADRDRQQPPFAELTPFES